MSKKLTEGTAATCIRCHTELPDGANFCPRCGKRLASAPAANRRRTRRPNGSGSVYKLKGNRSKPWVAWNGKVIGTFATSTQATLALDEYNRSTATTDMYNITLGQVYARLQQSDEWQKLTDKGREGLQSAWNRLLPLEGRVARTLTAEDFQKVIREAKKEQRYKTLTPAQYHALSPSKRARYDALKSAPPEPLGYEGKAKIKQLVVHLYRVMIRLGLAENNLGELLVLPHADKSTKRNFTAEEQAILRRHDADDAVKMILILIDMGLRIGELLTLPKERVDLETGMIHWGSKTDAGKDRPVPIPETTMPYIRYFYAQPGPLLISNGGQKITEDAFRRQYFYPALDRLGIQYQQDGKNIITPHRARHTFIADSVAAGVAPEALKTIAGHSKYSTTIDKYNDAADEVYLRKELEKKSKNF